MLTLISTLVCGCIHVLALVIPALSFLHPWSPLMTFFCGTFPAVGAALIGINYQGEFKRIEKRSKIMKHQLEPVIDAVINLRGRMEANEIHPPFSPEASELAAHASDLLVRDVLAWHDVVLDRPLTHPA